MSQQYSVVYGRRTHILHELEEVPFHELEHKEELVVFSDNFLQLDDVGVAQLLQGLHLSELHALFPTARRQERYTDQTLLFRRCWGEVRKHQAVVASNLQGLYAVCGSLVYFVSLVMKNASRVGSDTASEGPTNINNSRTEVPMLL